MTITSISTVVAVAGTRTHAAPGADQPTRRRILSRRDVRVGVECRRILSRRDAGVGVECRKIR